MSVYLHIHCGVNINSTTCLKLSRHCSFIHGRGQVSSFNVRGLKAAFVSAEDCDMEVVKGIHGGKCQIMLISPESTISKQYWREMLRAHVYQQNLVAIVIDEAHCVSKWLVGTHLLPIHEKCVIQACFMYYSIHTYKSCFFSLGLPKRITGNYFCPID